MADKKDLVQTIQAKMTAFLESSPADDICRKAAVATGLDKVVVFEAVLVSGVLLLALVLGAELVVDIICFVYPFISSVKALERGASAGRSQWITYWMTFFTFQTVESLMPRVLSSIPFYFWFKLAFMVWCYHPVTLGAVVIYKIVEPIRDEVMPLLDSLLESVVPTAAAAAKQPAEKKSSEADGRYVPSGITVHLDSLEMSAVAASTEDGDESTGAAPKALYVEIFLGSAVEGSAQPKCVGAKYKTPPLTGEKLNFDYKLTLVPPTDILNQPGANLCFTVKERMTFGDDPVVFNIHTPIDISTLQSAERSRSPESDGDLVSVSVGRRNVSLKNDLGSITGWIELISER